MLTLLRRGYTDVVDADLSKYFDTIPHRELMQSIARRIVDSNMLRLIKQWLQAPWKSPTGMACGAWPAGRPITWVPQGGVISPLVANLYMNRFLKHWRPSGRGEAWQAHVINYADDFVILSRGYATEALAWTDRVMTRLGLSLNRTKTCVRNARQERFDFLVTASAALLPADRTLVICGSILLSVGELRGTDPRWRSLPRTLSLVTRKLSLTPAAPPEPTGTGPPHAIPA